jgi:hypothetical protein
MRVGGVYSIKASGRLAYFIITISKNNIAIAKHFFYTVNLYINVCIIDRGGPWVPTGAYNQKQE